MAFSADAARVAGNIETIATYNSLPNEPGVTRQLFTEPEVGARNYFKSLLTEAGMEVREDAIGNIYGTLPGTDRSLAPVWSGSHIDTVHNGGCFDGVVGIVGALEACRMIRENNLPHQRDITVLVYSSEENGRFGMGCVGSRAMGGHLALEETKALKDDDGVTLYEELERLGYTKMDYAGTVLKRTGDAFASVELHIEQAPLLERHGLSVGIVTAICAPSYISVSIRGQQEHAGSTPMKSRRDAMVGAALVIAELESIARSYGNDHTVATVGKLAVYPNSSNVIPGRVDFTIDIRDIDEDVKTAVTEKICSYIDTVCAIRGLAAEHVVTTDDLPCHCDAAITETIAEAVRGRNLPEFRMTSGAYHDSLLISEFVPIGMIFVPSRNGISHDPSEFTENADIVAGINVLADALLALSNRDSL